MNRLHKWFTVGRMLSVSAKKGKAVEFDPKKLLKDKRVIEEINRHKWLESEIAGYDVGFDKAAEEWLNNYASAWVSYHDPQLKHFGKINSGKSSKSK